MMRTNALTAPNNKYNVKKMTKNKIKHTEEKEKKKIFFWP